MNNEMDEQLSLSVALTEQFEQVRGYFFSNFAFSKLIDVAKYGSVRV